MIRHLCPPPAGPWSPGSLHDLALGRWPSTRAVNEVNDGGPKVAVYFPDDDEPTAGDLAAWDAEVAAWVEPPAPPVLDESMVAQASALAVAMLSDPDQFAALVAQVSGSARPALDYVAGAVTEAAAATSP